MLTVLIKNCIKINPEENNGYIKIITRFIRYDAEYSQTSH